MKLLRLITHGNLLQFCLEVIVRLPKVLGI